MNQRNYFFLIVTYHFFPVLGEIGVDALANNNLKKSYISVIVPTVDLGFLDTVFCSIAITGLNPEMCLHLALLISLQTDEHKHYMFLNIFFDPQQI